MYRSFFSAVTIGALLVKKADRKEFFNNIIPSVASQSLPPVSQGTFQAVTTTQQIKRAISREQQVAADAISAVAVVSAKPAGPDKKLTNAEINGFPALSRVARQDLVDKINAVALVADQQVQLAKAQTQTVLAEEIGALVGKLYDLNRKSDGTIKIATLQDVDLDVAPQLKKILVANEDLLKKVKGLPTLPALSTVKTATKP